MKYALLFILCLLFSLCQLQAQTDAICTNPLAEQVMKGNYNPALYKAELVISNPATIAQGINARVSADSLKRYIIKLASFRNRNSGSDTNSSVIGIGAARRWIYAKFGEFSAANNNRLLPSYLQFNFDLCGKKQHRNIFAVLPGSDSSLKDIILIEGHVDSRCENVCDSLCLAQGVEDNASGTALVMELARVMSAYTFSRTIVFVVTIGEEQGLNGATAFANYVKEKGIAMRAVLNNDVIGGTVCGHTASQPGCSVFNSVDSTHVRIFSSGSFNSPHKGLARFIKLEYKEMLLPFVQVPMSIVLMSPEDRTGRGGDHIPFRQNGNTAVRLTAANENGNADVTNVNYTDRQHSFRDTLGIDANNDAVIDSFYVDFNYLARNTVINGNAAAMAALGPRTPDFTLGVNGNDLLVHVTQQQQYLHYRVGVRSLTNDWDSVYTFTGRLDDTITTPGAANYYLSIASVDENGIESLFSRELTAKVVSVEDEPQPTAKQKGITLLQNHPNPADEATYISVLVEAEPSSASALIRITDLRGEVVREIPLQLHQGMNEVLYEHGYGINGSYYYSLVLDGKTLMTKQMVFAN